ncbi:hypothetical protein [Yimella sp. cx-51]|uniref:hypothetical protein n=1 Tax=Yimella sp. cx-51 TaxID=2770551 RepID=UPI00165E07D1|nr:hypothetical protein [Yimella sp. cx-51]MBC9957939.1 hypothetical protein [Yimella sp. cx-51]QTH38073.1 hypothetical protein J5M86_14785 [Yimella sp. cx-51]
MDTWFGWTLDRDGLGRIVREYTGEGAGFDGSNPGVPEVGDTSHLPVGEGLAYDRQSPTPHGGSWTGWLTGR